MSVLMPHSERASVLTIAASDCAGLAGIQMDIRTQSALAVHTITVVTAITAQNNQGVSACNPVGASVLAGQLEAVRELECAAVKIGVLVDREQLAVVLAHLQGVSAPVVYDPVMEASSGFAFAEAGLIEVLRRELLPRCALVTPNLPEAARLAGIPINSYRDMRLAARKIRELGAGQVLIKAGHLDGTEPWVQDYFCSAEGGFWLASPRSDNPNSRGTGCALASAAAAALARGYALKDAVIIAKMAINQGYRHAYGLGGERGPVVVVRFPNEQIDLPRLLDAPAQGRDQVRAFPPCSVPAHPSAPSCSGPSYSGPHRELGLYPVVDRAAWLERLLPLGITTAQLRVKDLEGEALTGEIAAAIAVARRSGCRLFINDYWQHSVALGAYGVHLGQEDLATADLGAIRQAGLRLGISSHCHYEVARAHALRPSYIACGPVYPTTSKVMPWSPLGLHGLTYWQGLLDYPLVAIGGIDEDRIEGVASTGVSGIALISAITGAGDPEGAALRLLAGIARGRSAR